MIPSDLATRLRLLTEGAVQPVSPAAPISAELPELLPGQRFTARIETVLPDGTFRALVAGKSVTLALPQSASPGDSLELIVAERTARVVIATRSERTEPQTPTTTLSRAGQLISVLLSAQDNAGTGPAIGRLEPLLPQPAAQAAPLAAALRQALAESGLFYEAHQAQWIAGRFPLAQLLKEPQGKHSPLLARPAAADAPAAAPRTAPAATPTPGGELPLPTSSEGEPRPAGATAALPPDLLPVVQQQLDSAATHRILWQGELWPGQTLQWEIEEGGRGQGSSEQEEQHPWMTRLKLTLPALGEVAADLTLSPVGLKIALVAPPRTSEQLRAGQAELGSALQATGLPLVAMKVESHGEG